MWCVKSQDLTVKVEFLETVKVNVLWNDMLVTIPLFLKTCNNFIYKSVTNLNKCPKNASNKKELKRKKLLAWGDSRAEALP